VTTLVDTYDPADPDPWLALQLDQSLPIDPEAKAALLRGGKSWSRRWLFNVVKPLIFLFFDLLTASLSSLAFSPRSDCK